MSARDISLGAVADAVAWLRDAARASRTPPGSPERRRKVAEVTRAATRAREAAEGYDGHLATEIRLSARVIELGIGYVADRSLGRANDARASARRDSDGDDSGDPPKTIRLHPRSARKPAG